MMPTLAQLWNTIEPIDRIFSGVFIASAVVGVALWARGILPVLLRLGSGLASRKIAVLAKGDNQAELSNLLLDSGLFRGRNVLGIASLAELGRAENATILLLHWPDWGVELQSVLTMKHDHVALIIYAPQGGGFVPADAIKQLENVRHTTIVNFRGRLLNDLVVSMITTSQEKRR